MDTGLFCVNCECMVEHYFDGDTGGTYACDCSTAPAGDVMEYPSGWTDGEPMSPYDTLEEKYL